jgi:hypothetical protein
MPLLDGCCGGDGRSVSKFGMYLLPQDERTFADASARALAVSKRHPYTVYVEGLVHQLLSMR